MIVKVGRPFWTGIYTFAWTLGGLWGVDVVDVAVHPIQVNNWYAALLYCLIISIAVYAKAKRDEIVIKRNGENGKKTQDHDG